MNYLAKGGRNQKTVEDKEIQDIVQKVGQVAVGQAPEAAGAT